jgi:hypothetical protein
MHIRPTIPSAAALSRRGTVDRIDCDLLGVVLLAAAEDVVGLCDRHAGDWGDDPARLRPLLARLEQIYADIRAELGEPRVRLAGGLVPKGLGR